MRVHLMSDLVTNSPEYGALGIFESPIRLPGDAFRDGLTERGFPSVTQAQLARSAEEYLEGVQIDAYLSQVHSARYAD